MNMLRLKPSANLMRPCCPARGWSDFGAVGQSFRPWCWWNHLYTNRLVNQPLNHLSEMIQCGVWCVWLCRDLVSMIQLRFLYVGCETVLEPWSDIFGTEQIGVAEDEFLNIVWCNSVAWSSLSFLAGKKSPQESPLIPLSKDKIFPV